MMLELAGRYPVRLLCQTLRVSPSGYYAWRKRGLSRRQQENERLLQAIRTMHQQTRGVYGYRRIFAALKAQGIACGKHRVRRLMQLHGLRAKRRRRYRTTTQSRHRLPVAPNILARDFSTAAANRKWVSDITFIPTHAGWLYLAVIMDLYSRQVVGWAMEPRLDKELGLKALRMALASRQPPAKLLHHSDRGVQYANNEFQQLLRAHKAIASMSRTGNAYDNAPMESFFASLKRELIHFRNYRTRDEARADIFEYIEVFYNRQRLHSALQYQSPVEFEARQHAL